MLTDVNDNSIEEERKLIEDISNSSIGLTIIGISDEFKSDVCERLKNTHGFNYFCAVETDDLKKYLYDNFDYTFFPFAYDIEISI